MEKPYYVKIDVLIIINKSIAVIIEDKTYTSEHSNQMARYKEGLEHLQTQDKGSLNIDENTYSISKIMSVYWKTGFFYDYDKRVKADTIVDSDYLVGLLGEYRSENQVIDMYVQNLLDNREWYSEHKKYWEQANPNSGYNEWNTNLCRNQIAQYTMMREIFPEKMTDDELLNPISHGTSFGRPWTEMTIYYNNGFEGQKGGNFELFWRIDTDSKGSYISLRLYKSEKGRWDDRYDTFKEYVKAYIGSECLYSWSDIDPGNTKSYKEADIAHFTINRELWISDGEKLKEFIRRLTDDIIAFAGKTYDS